MCDIVLIPLMNITISQTDTEKNKGRDKISEKKMRERIESGNEYVICFYQGSDRKVS